MLTWNRKRVLLASFTIGAATVVALAYAVAAFRQCIPLWLTPLIDGYGGNLTAGIVTSLLFLPLAIYIGAETEDAVAQIRKVTERRERFLRSQESIRRFDEFMRNEAYHDIRFPEVNRDKAPYGLEYTIVPVRDLRTGRPLMHETEMESLYVVRVLEPAQAEILRPEQLSQYDGSPIKPGRNYFCKYFNDSWHLGESTVDQPYAFYLSGKLGRPERPQTADEFVASVNGG